MHVFHLVNIVAVFLLAGLPHDARAGDRSMAAVPGAQMPVDIDYFVSPAGNDSNSGRQRQMPLRTIQQALRLARPGQRIAIAAGEYFEDLRSTRSGTVDQPIWLTGEPGAIVKGAGKSRIVELKHSHIVLANFAIDGEVHDASGKRRYRDKLIYAVGRTVDGITGLRLLNLDLRNAAGECIRMKYFAHHNEIAHSRIRRCGIRDFELGRGGKNGEGIYIGTAPEQLERNPGTEPDRSNSNWIHHNRFDTRGAECVDVKEAAMNNLVEYNECTGQMDENSAGISFRGNRNVARFNTIWGNRGAGIRFGGDTAADGIENDAYGNTLRDNATAAFKVMRHPQGRVCGNAIESPLARIVSGKFTQGFDPAAACPDAGFGSSALEPIAIHDRSA